MLAPDKISKKTLQKKTELWFIFRKLRIDIPQSSENWEELEGFLNSKRIVLFFLANSKVKY